MILKQLGWNRKANFVLFTLAMAGVIIANFLLLPKLKGVSVGGCGTGGGCDAVSKSPYAMIVGIHVSAFGVLGYFLLAALSFARMLTSNETVRKQLGTLIAVGVAIAALFTTYLEYLMFFVILHICRWCMISAAITLTMGIIVLIERFKQKESASLSIPVHTLSAPVKHALRLWERNLFILVALLGGLGVVASKAYYDSRPPVTAPPRPVRVFDPKQFDPPDSHGLGPRNAKVFVIEFSNYECPHCHEVEPVMLKVREKYNEKVRFIVINRPLAQFRLGDYAAEVAEAVAAQNKDAYWKLHEKLLTSGILTEDTIRETVATLGIDTDRVWREMKEDRYKQGLDRDRQVAAKFGDPPTPTVFVNQQPFSTPLKSADLLRAIDLELAKATTPPPSPASPNKPPAKTDSR